MIGPLLGMMSATNTAYGAASTMFGAADAQMGLANNVSASMSPAGVMSTAQLDKALMLQGLNAKVQFQASQAMLSSSQAVLDDIQKQRQRLMDASATLV